MFSLALRAVGPSHRSVGLVLSSTPLFRLAAPAVAGAGAAASQSLLLSASSPSSSAPSRAFTTRRRRKELRRDAALAQRKVVQFASLFDPLRTARLQVGQTLRYLGWEVNANERVSGGVVLDYTLRDWFCAIEVVGADKFVLPGSANASDDHGFGPGVRPAGTPAAPPPTTSAGAAAAVWAAHPHKSAFPSAPPPWLSPVRGLVLDAETAARHAAIRAKGWKLAVVPVPEWEVAANRPGASHYARRDVLLKLTVGLSPFEARPAELQSQTGLGGQGKQSNISSSSGSVARAAPEASAAGGFDSSAAAATRRVSDARAAAADLIFAKEESAVGRSRKLRGAARRRVTRAADDATEAAAAAAAAEGGAK